MSAWHTMIMSTCLDQALNLRTFMSRVLGAGENSHGLVLGGQAFVSGQQGEEELTDLCVFL